MQLLGKILTFIGLLMLFWRISSGAWQLPISFNRRREQPALAEDDDPETQEYAACISVLTEACGGNTALALRLIEDEMLLNEQLTPRQAAEAAFDRLMKNMSKPL